MRRMILALVVGLAISCAGGMTLRQQNIGGVDIATKSLQGAADAEHVVCDPSVPLTQPVLVCTAVAHTLQLSDAAHRTISGHLAAAATALGAYAANLQQGTALPAAATVDQPLADALAAIQAIPGGGGAATAITAIAIDVQTAQADWAKLKAEVAALTASASGGS